LTHGGKIRAGFAIWLTGLPSSGKTTIAQALARTLADRGISVQVLDSDSLREKLTPRPTYSQEERDWFYGVITFLADMLAANGVNVLIAATAHRREYREEARKRIRQFIEVFVDCPPEVCRQRGSKGLWAKADRGRIAALPGTGISYEEPADPEVHIRADRLTVEEGVERILAAMERKEFLRRAPKTGESCHAGKACG
jgi:adenylylsulfate kinase